MPLKRQEGEQMSLFVRKKIQGSFFNKKRGSISIIFLMLLVIVLGAVSYSLYIGQSVTHKIKLQNASDWSAYAMGAHTSQGLNMVSANNLAIGSAIHVSSSVPILASYMSFAYAFTSDEWDLIKSMASTTVESVSLGTVKIRDRYQDKVWNNLIPISGTYLGIATGLTSFNNIIVEYWQIPTMLIPSEIARVNVPESVGIGLQGFGSDGILTYGGMKQTTPKDTVCKSIKSSKEVSERDNFMLWFTGPLRTLGSGASDAIDTVNTAIGVVAKMFPVKLGFSGCGYGLKVPIVDAVWKLLENLELGTVGAILNVSTTTARIEKIYNQHEKDTDWFGDIKCGFEEVIDSGVGAVENTLGSNNDDFINRFYFEKYLKSLKNQARHAGKSSVMQCQLNPSDSNSKPLKNHYMHIGSNGQKVCINLKTIDTSCVFKEYLRSRIDNVCNHLKSWIKGCESKYGDLAPKDYPGKYEGYDEPIVDYANQATSFANRLGREWSVGALVGSVTHDALGGVVDLLSADSYKPKDTKRAGRLGFIYVGDQVEFEKSVSSLSIVIKGLQHQRGVAPECPEALQVKIGDTVQCDRSIIKGMSSFGRTDQKSKDSTDGGQEDGLVQDEIDQNTLSQDSLSQDSLNQDGPDESKQKNISPQKNNIVRLMASGLDDLTEKDANSLDHILSTTQIAKARAKAVPTHSYEGKNNSTFWPGWQSKLVN